VMAKHYKSYSKSYDNRTNLINILLMCCSNDLLTLYDSLKTDFPDRMMFVSSVQFIDAIMDSVEFYKPRYDKR
jgi:hypothetical protein